MSAPRAGATLLELIVALAILGLMAGVAGVAFRAGDGLTPAAGRAARVAEARRTALESRRPVRFTLEDAEGTAFPDGRVLVEGGEVEPLTGRPRARR